VAGGNAACSFEGLKLTPSPSSPRFAVELGPGSETSPGDGLIEAEQMATKGEDGGGSGLTSAKSDAQRQNRRSSAWRRVMPRVVLDERNFRKVKIPFRKVRALRWRRGMEADNDHYEEEKQA